MKVVSPPWNSAWLSGMARISQLRCWAASSGSSMAQEPAAGERVELAGERGVGALGALGVPGARQVGEPIGLGDDDASQPEQVGSGDVDDVLTGEPPQVAVEVVAVGQGVDHVVGARLGGVDLAGDDGGEQPLLVGEVLVHGLLGDGGEGGDLVHRRAAEALGQEDGLRGLQDGVVLAGRSPEDGFVAHLRATSGRCAVAGGHGRDVVLDGPVLMDSTVRSSSKETTGRSHR